MTAILGVDPGHTGALAWIVGGKCVEMIDMPVTDKRVDANELRHLLIKRPVDLAVVGVAVVMVLDDKDLCQNAKIVLGAVAPTPLEAKKAEEVLIGRKVDDARIEEVAKIASGEARPITDVRGSAEFRREIVKVLTRRAVKLILAK